MKHLGDITTIDGATAPLVDIITGGSPCQDLSVAGKRAGLDGERSGLFMEQIRIIKEMRDESRRLLSIQGTDYNRRDIKPRYMVWENVAGAFSSNGGEDFRAVLEETARIAEGGVCIPQLPEGQRWPHAGCIMGNGWSIAWRLHDAQYWGVPQRRKRISLVADFGDNTAPKVLFEQKSMPGDPKQSGEERKDTSATIRASSEETISFQERAGKPGGGTNTSSAKILCRQPEPVSIGNGQVHDAMSPSIGVAKTLNCMVDPAKVVTYGLDRAAYNQGQNAQDAWSVMDELMTTIKALQPKLYQATIDRIKDQ